MPTDASGYIDDLSIGVPYEAYLGFGLVIVVYSVAGLADIIEYQMPAVVWFAVAAGAFGYLVDQVRTSRTKQSQTTPTDTADSEDDSFFRVPFEAQIGVLLVFLGYGIAVLVDIVTYQIPAVLWIAVAAGLFGYLVHQIRPS